MKTAVEPYLERNWGP